MRGGGEPPAGARAPRAPAAPRHLRRLTHGGRRPAARPHRPPQPRLMSAPRAAKPWSIVLLFVSRRLDMSAIVTLIVGS